MSLRKALALAASLLALSFGAAAQAPQPFQVLNPPQPTEGGGKIEVIEFFWYGCPHCYSLEPAVNEWAKGLPKDVVFRRCPFGVDEAEQMIRSIKGAPLLLGARGRPVTDIKALSRVLAQLSQFAAEAGPRLRSVDLNPVFAMPEGQGAWAADAVLEVEEVAHGAES